MAPAPGDNKVYGNWVFMGVFEGLAFLIIRRYFGDIGGEDCAKGN